MPATSLIDQTFRTAAGALRLPFRVGDRAARQTFGLVQRVVGSHPAPKDDIDGVTLARKVESEVFRGPGAPKDRVDVNAVDGVVYLHGEVRRSQDVRDIERRVRAIPEVRDVENLLHTRKTPAPSRADAPGRQKARATSRRPRPRKEPQHVAGDKEPPGAEPSPEVLAEEGRGRQPAPMGSRDQGESEG